MNEFILEEKHKYWDNKITLKEYIKDTEESGYIDCTGNLEYEFWYILENLKKLNNLQSKIDKAIEYIINHSEEYKPHFRKIELDTVQCNELLNILFEEDK